METVIILSVNPNPYPGFFIDIEGLDGSGSTTQAELLKKRLSKEGFDVYTTKEPTDNVIGGLIRGALSGVYKLPPAALQLLFVADRYHHLDRQIIPILQNHNVLISDRFLWSTIAFGSVDLSRKWLVALHQYCFIPDLSIFLRVSPKTCLSRIKKDRFDFELFEQEKKMWKVWDAYEWLVKEFPGQIVIVSGEDSVAEVAKKIFEQVENHPKIKRFKARSHSS